MSCNEKPNPRTRREALSMLGQGFGLTALAATTQRALAQTAGSQGGEAPDGGVPGVLTGKLHFKPRAKRVVFLFMNGGVSHIDSFDPKPMVDKYDGHPMPGSVPVTQRHVGNLMKSPFKFRKYGQSGMDFSELWPNVGGIADEICMVRSMYADIPNHEPTTTLFNTGSNVAGRPSMGSWISYGLGTENANLPSFVVMVPALPISGGSPMWSSAFLPAIHQGTLVHNAWVDGEVFDARKAIPNLNNPSIQPALQNAELNFLRGLNKMQLRGDLEMEASIRSMEIAYRMQTEAPDVFDISRESKSVLEMYGPGSPALGCLLAVRLIEKGVRMVQLYQGKGDPFDSHNDIMQHVNAAREGDRPYAALVKDLKQRGLLDETLVVCGTEFGRTPAVETANTSPDGKVVNGRDHNHYGFSIWLAGAGIKKGMIYGATDDFGYKVVDKKVHPHDLQATILYLLGIDHTKLTYQYSGREMRLTDTNGEVIHDILA
jgi:hypothetical protein